MLSLVVLALFTNTLLPGLFRHAYGASWDICPFATTCTAEVSSQMAMLRHKDKCELDTISMSGQDPSTHFVHAGAMLHSGLWSCMYVIMYAKDFKTKPRNIPNNILFCQRFQVQTSIF